LTGFRITARALDSHYVSEQILKEYRGLEECAQPANDEEAGDVAAKKVVFVLEEEAEPTHDLGAASALRHR
jgi:hypothetical protein